MILHLVVGMKDRLQVVVTECVAQAKRVRPGFRHPRIA